MRFMNNGQNSSSFMMAPTAPFWGFLSHNEVNAVILSREFATEMEKMFTRDPAEPERVQMGRMGKRPLFPGAKEWFAHLFSHWL